MRRSLFAFAVTALTFAACGGKGGGDKPAGATGGGATPAATTAPAPAANLSASSSPANPEVLMEPSKLTEKAPDQFKAKFETTKGSFVIAVTRDWAPNGADRFYNMVKAGFYKDIAFFRAIDGFMVQFGIHGDPKVAKAWRDAKINDDPVKQSNKPGMVTFATAGPNTRTTQIFINYGENSRLDGMGFSPFGQVVEGMDIVNSLYKGYGEGAPRGRGPDQGRAQAEGNAYFKKDFPQMDYINSAAIL